MMGVLQLLWVITSICMFYLSVTDGIFIHSDESWFIFFRFRTLLCRWDEKAPYLFTKTWSFYCNIFAHLAFINGLTACVGRARKSAYETRSVQTDKNGTSRHFVCICVGVFCVLIHPVHATHYIHFSSHRRFVCSERKLVTSRQHRRCFVLQALNTVYCS